MLRLQRAPQTSGDSSYLETIVYILRNLEIANCWQFRVGMGFYMLVSHNDMLVLISFFLPLIFIGHNCRSLYTVYQKAL